ncbi:MAG: hypothetical protein HQL06_13070 [Nitrospirae bacterium]|nr:hypothetical protein [Nitrospirota bacterium]
MSALSQRALKQYLYDQSKDTLIEEILVTVSKFKVVEEFYRSKIDDDSVALARYKGIIKKAFTISLTTRKVRFPIANKAVNDFRKVASSSKSVADIMLFFVETCIEHKKTYGSMTSEFNRNMENMYKDAIKYIEDKGLKDVFSDRCKSISDVTSGFVFGRFVKIIHIGQDKIDEPDGYQY